jgi:hypothetical protein
MSSPSQRGGTFSTTWLPLVEACLRRGVHYLDLTGEVMVFEGIRLRGADARRRGIVLLPGVGFDVVPSDCLAAHVAAELPGARTLRLAVSGLELVSRGSARTLAELAGHQPLVRRDGQLSAIPAGSLERRFDYGSGLAASVAVSWGDLASGFMTGIAIETYFEATPAVRAMVAASRFDPAPPRWWYEAHTAWLADGDAAARGSRAAGSSRGRTSGWPDRALAPARLRHTVSRANVDGYRRGGLGRQLRARISDTGAPYGADFILKWRRHARGLAG